ncbi:glycopeptide [Panus rudis PR-1116 ss-1]|nr:glycopeptide [Panus rudis PR-1116 ss-1]
MLSLTTFLVAIVASLASQVAGETHTVTFDNRCGRGTPTLRAQNGAILSTGGAYTIRGPLIGAIAYLQTGGCGNNGEGCTLIETTLRNPPSPGAGSSTDISLIPPHTFSVTSGFGYYNGCDRTGADCTNPNCPTAFHKPDDTHVQVACQTNDVNLVITFCA